MTSEHDAGQPLTHELLAELVAGGPDLAPARERWIALLTHPSPRVRLAAEVALVELTRAVPHVSADSAKAARRIPHRVPQFGMTEPKRHCLRCFGHDFWVDGDGRLHCDGCEPLRVV